MVGRPFEHPITLGNDVPPKIEASMENVDLQGRDLDSFARDVLAHALRDGISWILVDYPILPEGATAADEAPLRPYWVEIPLENMIAYRTATVDGRPKVVHTRWYECHEIQVDLWETREVRRIRVWEPGLVQLWEQQQAQGQTDQRWVLVAESTISLEEVPIVPIYGARTGFWTAEPPLLDMAWLNVQHWQSMSDQRNILHVARVPLLAADEDVRADPQAPVAAKANGIITGFKGLKFVEHTGAAIGAGKQDLDDLEAKMRKVAGEFAAGQVERTATESGIEAGEHTSWLRRIVENFEDALEECLRLSAVWIGLSEGGSLTVTSDWDEERMAADLLTALTAARTSGGLSQEAYSWNLQQGGLLPPERTVEQEVEAIQTEGPKPMPRGVPPTKPQPPGGAPTAGEAA
jgi:hypothetical protein